MHNDSPSAPLRRRLIQGLALGGLPAMLGAPAQAATAAWPRKSIRLVVGFPPGSSPDALARTVADPLGALLQQSVIVDNKVGATGAIGVDAVARATDEHTIGLTGNGPLTTAKLLNPSTPYEFHRDLRSISLLASSPFVLVGPVTAPATDTASLLAYAKAQGERLSYGSVGVGSGGHLAMELLKTITGIKPVHVPFPGFPQVATAMMGGQIDLAFMVPSVALPQARAGRLRIYGISSASPFPAFSEIPPIQDALGRHAFDITSWNAIFGPASMPAAIAQRISEMLSRVVRTPDIRQRLFDQGWQAMGTAPEAMTRRVREDTAMWADVIRLTGTRNE